MLNIADSLKTVKNSIAEQALAAGRLADAVTLIAVSKTKPLAAVQTALAAGQQHFGENYLQEALPKIAATQDSPACWHFIGPVQSNKTRAIAENFDWLHTAERLKIVDRLAQQRPKHLKPLQLCVQVNVSGDPAKAGLTPSQLPAFLVECSALEGVTLAGLMTITQQSTNAQQISQWFATLRTLRDEYQQQYPQLNELSMGMSGDYAAAIQQGATMVRVGSAIFGAR